MFRQKGAFWRSPGKTEFRRPATHLDCHATVGKPSSEMFSLYNSEGEMIAFFEYNWMMQGRGCRKGHVVKTAKGLKFKRPEL